MPIESLRDHSLCDPAIPLNSSQSDTLHNLPTFL